MEDARIRLFIFAARVRRPSTITYHDNDGPRGIVRNEADEVQQPAMKLNVRGNIRRKNSALLASLVIRPAGSIAILLSARILAILARRFLQVVIPAAQLVTLVLG